MFFYDGFVYGGEPVSRIRITNVKPLPDRILLITFNTGEQRVFDCSILNGPAFQKLDEEMLRHPVIEHGVITWDDGKIDCAPEYMYEHSYEYAKEML